MADYPIIVSVQPSLAMVVEPGDLTRYEFVAVMKWDTIEVVVLNDGFFDKITFLKSTGEFYKSYRGNDTNPWTITAAKIARNKFMEMEGM
jgi:hypothetical protein